MALNGPVRAIAKREYRLRHPHARVPEWRRRVLGGASPRGVLVSEATTSFGPAHWTRALMLSPRAQPWGSRSGFGRTHSGRTREAPGSVRESNTTNLQCPGERFEPQRVDILTNDPQRSGCPTRDHTADGTRTRPSSDPPRDRAQRDTIPWTRGLLPHRFAPLRYHLATGIVA